MPPKASSLLKAAAAAAGLVGSSGTVGKRGAGAPASLSSPSAEKGDGKGVPRLVMPPGMSPPVDANSVSVSKASVPAKPPGLGPPAAKLWMPGKGKGGSGKGGKTEQQAPKYDIVKLCTDIYGLGKLSPGDWKSGCSKVYNQIMNDKGLADYMQGSTQPVKDQIRSACTASMDHFLSWHQPKIEARLNELCGKSEEGVANKASNTGKGKPEGESGKGSKQSGKGTKQSAKASAKAKALVPETKSKWEKPQSKWEKPKRIWGQKEKPQSKTGSNMIQVKWQAPEKAASSSDAKVAAMGADPTPAAAPSRGPAGRGRGTSMPAWMTAGLGNAATAAVDKKPEIPEGGAAQESEESSESEDLLAETFAERDVTAAKLLKGKPGKVGKRGGGWAKTKRGGGGIKRGGGGGGGGAKSGGGNAGGGKAKQKQSWKKKGW